MIFFMEHADERFVMHSEDAQLVANDGRLLSGEEAILYWEEKKRTMVKVWEQLQVGDIVKVEDIDVPLRVVTVKGDPMLLGSDYGGECDEVPNQIIMFEQYEIERILERR